MSAQRTQMYYCIKNHEDKHKFSKLKMLFNHTHRMYDTND